MTEIEQHSQRPTRHPISRRDFLKAAGVVGFVLAVGEGVNSVVRYFDNGNEIVFHPEMLLPSMGRLHCKEGIYAEGFIPITEAGKEDIENVFGGILPSIGGIIKEMKGGSLMLIFSGEEKGTIMQVRTNSGPEEKQKFFNALLNMGFNVQDVFVQLRPAIGEPAVVIKAQMITENGPFTVVMDFNPKQLPEMESEEYTSEAFSVADKINALFRQVDDGALSQHTAPIAYAATQDLVEYVANEVRSGKHVKQVLEGLGNKAEITATEYITENGKYTGIQEVSLVTGTELKVKRVFIGNDGNIMAIVDKEESGKIRRFKVNFKDIQTVLDPSMMSEKDYEDLLEKKKIEATKALSNNTQNSEQIYIQPGSFMDPTVHEMLIPPPVYQAEVVTPVGVIEGDPKTIFPSVCTAVAFPGFLALAARLKIDAHDKRKKKEEREKAWESMGK